MMGKIARNNDCRTVYNCGITGHKIETYFCLKKCSTGSDDKACCFCNPTTHHLLTTHKIADGDKKYFLF